MKITIIVLIVALVAVVAYSAKKITDLTADTQSLATTAAGYVNATNGNMSDYQLAQPLVKALTNLNTVSISNASGVLQMQ